MLNHCLCLGPNKPTVIIFFYCFLVCVSPSESISRLRLAKVRGNNSGGGAITLQGQGGSDPSTSHIIKKICISKPLFPNIDDEKYSKNEISGVPTPVVRVLEKFTYRDASFKLVDTSSFLHHSLFTIRPCLLSLILLRRKNFLYHSDISLPGRISHHML